MPILIFPWYNWYSAGATGKKYELNTNATQFKFKMMDLYTTNVTEADIKSNDDTVYIFNLTDSNGEVSPDLIRGFYIKLLGNTSQSLKIGFCSKTYGKLVPGSFCGSYLYSVRLLDSTDDPLKPHLNMEGYEYFYI